MKFFVFCILAAIFLPLLMGVNKGMEKLTKNEKRKEELKADNENLSNAWMLYVGVIVLVILGAMFGC